MRKLTFIIFVILIISGCSSTANSTVDTKSNVNVQSTPIVSSPAPQTTKTNLTTEQRKTKVSESTTKLTKEVDEVKSVTWYSDPSSVKAIDKNDFSIYFGVKEGEYIPVMRFKIQYGGDDWLFIKKYTLKIDDQLYTIDVNSDYLHQDNKTKVWEWYDAPVTKQSYDVINAIVSSKKTILRYEGKDKNFDRDITEDEKKALKNIVDAFVASGGDINYK